MNAAEVVSVFAMASAFLRYFLHYFAILFI